MRPQQGSDNGARPHAPPGIPMHDFWPDSGYLHLERTPAGWLRPTDAYLRHLVDSLGELALVEESDSAEIALHRALCETPSRVVGDEELAALQDPDARANYRMFLAFRDALLAAGTLEAYYLGVMRSGRITTPPLLIDRVVAAIVRHLLDASGDSYEARAGELLFRAQQLTIANGRMLAADRETLQRRTPGPGVLGALIGGAGLAASSELDVLSNENAVEYWTRSADHDFVLDLTHELTVALDQGLNFKLTRARSGLKALSGVLEKWVGHLLGAAVSITPLAAIDDSAWRWHIGLDADSMALLNDLYEDRPVDDERMQRLVSLFRLEFAVPAEARADLVGKPVYLGLAMDARSTLKLKPQNLLLNLPLAAA